jgi:hypothetical protein
MDKPSHLTVNKIDDSIASLRDRVRWAKRARLAAALLFLVPLVAYPLFMFVVSIADQGPEKGMILLPILYYGLFASPLLLLPVIAWVVFHFRCRTLQQRLSLSPGFSCARQV